ncbi:MAG: sigma-70 family RNA polymerase sigma factor [Planctomycetota bacterium]
MSNNAQGNNARPSDASTSQPVDQRPATDDAAGNDRPDPDGAGSLNGGELSTDGELALIGKATEGDQAALEQLFVRYHPELHAYIDRKIPANVRASISTDDILQETYLKGFMAIGRFEPQGRGSLLAWLKVIASRKLTDAWRSKGREKRSDRPAHSPGGSDVNSSLRGLLSLVAIDGLGPGDEAMLDELQSEFQVALAGMSEKYRDAIRLRYLEGLPLETVAERLDTTEGAVRGLCHRARQELRERLMRLSRFI